MTVSADDPDPDDEFLDEESVREIVIDCGDGQMAASQEEEPDGVLQIDDEVVIIRTVYPDS